jgi:hypothetical protein
MSNVVKFPEIRECAEVEAIYRRELGFVICPHKVYLPLHHCAICAEKALKELGKALFGK